MNLIPTNSDNYMISKIVNRYNVVLSQAYLIQSFRKFILYNWVLRARSKNWSLIRKLPNYQFLSLIPGKKNLVSGYSQLRWNNKQKINKQGYLDNRLTTSKRQAYLIITAPFLPLHYLVNTSHSIFMAPSLETESCKIVL